MGTEFFNCAGCNVITDSEVSFSCGACSENFCPSCEPSEVLRECDEACRGTLDRVCQCKDKCMCEKDCTCAEGEKECTCELTCLCADYCECEQECFCSAEVIGLRNEYEYVRDDSIYRICDECLNGPGSSSEEDSEEDEEVIEFLLRKAGFASMDEARKARVAEDSPGEPAAKKQKT